jgi:hypothetical protein
LRRSNVESTAQTRGALTEDDLEEVLQAARQGSVNDYETASRLGWTRQRVSRIKKKFGAIELVQTIYRQNKAGTLSEPGEASEELVGSVEEFLKDEPPPPEIVGADSDVEPDIARIRASTEAYFDLKAQRAREKLHQHIRFPHGPVALFFLGDQHIGNAGADVRRMFEEQEKIMATPAAYAWQMGDVADNFVIGRLVAENWKQSLPVWEQWHLAKHYLSGFKDRLLAVNGGNHDFWSHKVSGIDYTMDITPSGVLYDADTIRASVYVGPHEFRVWTRHKWEGKSMYNPTHGQERGAREDDPDQDIYVGAHNHTGAVCREFIRKAERKVAIQIGTYKMVDDYAIERGFKRHDSSTACGVVLHDDGSFFAAANIQAILNYMRACYR